MSKLDANYKELQMTKSLKRKTVSGVMWSGIERFSLQGIQFIFNIIIARLLTPSDFGAMAMLTVFLQVSQTFVDAGFTNALIQKKNRTENDFFTQYFYCTSFLYNFIYNSSIHICILQYSTFNGFNESCSYYSNNKLVISNS